MQTIFRLPWSTEPSSDKALADKVLYQQQKSRQKPRVDIPVLNSKRKRTDSLEASPKNAQQVKKLKNANDGAVQPALEPAKGPDSLSKFTPAIAVARGDKAVKSEERPEGNHQLALSCGNATAQVAEAQWTAHESCNSPAVTLQQQQSVSSGLSDSNSTAASLLQSSISTPTTIATDTSSMAQIKPDVDKLRAVIEAQLNLEILHKHGELRLIDLELAKCQIGLEQLRRCELIPYPGTQAPSLAVSNGTGPALASPQGYTSPVHPAPWGVVDGPYARHYAKWLIPDPRFDPTPAQAAAMGIPLTARGARATRGSGAEPLLPAPTARNSRTSAGGRTQLSGDPSTPTASRDPMILKRQADGEWVRLRCNHCHRSNFNNVQGFLNHCRIAHHQEFKSHEAAAIACGEIVQIDEAQFPAAESVATPRESHSRPPMVATPLEQPLISPLINHPPFYNPLDRLVTHPYTPNMTPDVSPSTSAPPATTSFKPSLAPHLSALMQRRGLSTIGLDSTIRENKKKADLSVYNDSESEREDQKSKRQKTKKPRSRHPSGQHNVTVTKGSTLATGRPPSQKGSRAPQSAFAAQPPSRQPPPLHPSTSRLLSTPYGRVIPASPSDGDVDMDLSPGTAVDSNPGLVSDHDDDDDDADEARSTNGSHPEVMDVEIEDASDVEREGRKRVRVVESGGESVCRQGLGEGSGGMC